MSRAFVKETDTVDELPDRIVSDYPNYVTPDGMEAIERAIADFQRKLAEAQSQSDRNAISALSRELRYWDQRRSSAMVVMLSADSSVVRFGSTVTIERDDGRRQTFRIVGEDEADPAKGSLSHSSPMAQALLGKTTGDTVSVGQSEAEIVVIGDRSTD
ncbi:MAG: transcription elongation factor GreA [Xanthobacteraceae bacterium]|nr:transcription elongation factor GreA [Xanthobacteraceae bacterium]